MRPYKFIVNFLEHKVFKSFVVVVVASDEETAAYTLNHYLLSINIGNYTANVELLKGAGIYEGQDFGNTKR